ncbi:unnamed protein product [Urochloa decumbens]|uniref:Senescence domain-containing protein n=1 Tax=Urochloa decumbens TaxID=240449 RepID=A0ABC9E447_9POAL
MADLAPVEIGSPVSSSPTAAGEDATGPPPSEDLLLRIPGAQLHLIDRSRSHPLAAGDLSLLRIRSGGTSLAAIALLDPVQWPLARDVAAVKLDPCHYSFSLTVPPSADDPNPGTLHYGLTLAHPDDRLDALLAAYTSFSVHSVVGTKELESRVRDEVEAAAYWTAVAPNVEEYGGKVAKAIATGAEHLAKGILWCGEVTVDRLRWGNEVLKKRMQPGDANAEVSPEMLRRIKRAKKVTQMSEKVATGILSGVVKVTGYFTSSFANSKAGKKFFNLLPGEIVLASLDGFGKICDAVEVSGKNVLSTSSTVTTGLVSHKYCASPPQIRSCNSEYHPHFVLSSVFTLNLRVVQVRGQSCRCNQRRAGRRRARHRDGVGRVQDPAGLESEERPETHGAGHVDHQGERC